MVRIRSPHRCAAAIFTWLGVFAILLLLLKQLPAALPTTGPADASDRCHDRELYLWLPLQLLPVLKVVLLCSRPRSNLTFDYGGQCSLLLNSGGWVHVPYVRYCMPFLSNSYVQPAKHIVQLQVLGPECPLTQFSRTLTTSTITGARRPQEA